MKNFVKVATLAATLALAACQTNPNTAVSPKEDSVKSRHVANTEHQVWTSGDYNAANVAGKPTDKLCWQTGYYPDGNAVIGCDAVPTPPVVPTVKPTNAEINFDANALFDFNKSTIRPVGAQALTRLATALKSVQYSDAVVIGHTDSFGSDAYNDKLSLRRAEAIKSFLVGQGLSATTISTQGMGKRALLVSPASCKGKRAAQIACQQPNRRVSVGLNGVVVPESKVAEWKAFLSSVPGINVNVVK